MGAVAERLTEKDYDEALYVLNTSFSREGAPAEEVAGALLEDALRRCRRSDPDDMTVAVCRIRERASSRRASA